MIYNTGWANLKPQQLKYTPSLAAQAAKLLQLGQSLTATARALNISRASLRNWRERDPALNRAFDTFEANKAKQEAKRQKVRHFKEVASDIVDAAREDAEDPVKAGLEAQKQAKVKEAEKRPLSPGSCCHGALDSGRLDDGLGTTLLFLQTHQWNAPHGLSIGITGAPRSRGVQTGSDV